MAGCADDAMATGSRAAIAAAAAAAPGTIGTSRVAYRVTSASTMAASMSASGTSISRRSRITSAHSRRAASHAGAAVVVGPGATAGRGPVHPHPVPPRLRVDEDAVEVEDHRADAGDKLPERIDSLPRRAGRHPAPARRVRPSLVVCAGRRPAVDRAVDDLQEATDPVGLSVHAPQDRALHGRAHEAVPALHLHGEVADLHARPADQLARCSRTLLGNVDADGHHAEAGFGGRHHAPPRRRLLAPADPALGVAGRAERGEHRLHDGHHLRRDPVAGRRRRDPLAEPHVRSSCENHAVRPRRGYHAAPRPPGPVGVFFVCRTEGGSHVRRSTPAQLGRVPGAPWGHPAGRRAGLDPPRRRRPRLGALAVRPDRRGRRPAAPPHAAARAGRDHRRRHLRRDPGLPDRRGRQWPVVRHHRLRRRQRAASP